MENQPFLFEVRKKGKTYFHCRDKSCVPTREEQKSLLSAGYEIFVNGKKRSVWLP